MNINMILEGENMAEVGGDELLEAQAHIWKHIFRFINSMSLKCAVQLGIPDAIHRHGPHPMPLSQLVSALQLNPNKTAFIYHLMRLLTHSGFFQVTRDSEREEEEEGYMLTNSSRLLIRDNNPLSLAPFVLCMLEPYFMEPWHFLCTWFRSDDQTACDTTHGMPFWECLGNMPKYGDVFNAAMASDAKLAMSVLIRKYKDVFDGVGILVDVGGGTGTMAKAIAQAFPHIECIVFDLPQVVARKKEEQNLKYVAGDMFEVIPSADAFLLKWVLHDWSDEECVRILKNCKSAMTSNGNIRKVIVIDNKKKDDSIETQLFLDLQMMVIITGKEREEKEWARLVKEAGFSSYKISPIIGLRSLRDLSMSVSFQKNMFV